MLTILFDGIAYGMLLFVLACGLVGDARPDEFRQPRAWRVRHGRRLLHASCWSTGWACRSSRPCRSPSCSAPLLGFVLERTLYVHVYRKTPSRPGAVHHRPRLHVGRGGRLRHGRRSQVFVQLPDWLQGQVQRARRRHRRATACSSSSSAALLTVGAAAHPARETRFGSRLRAVRRRRARGARPRHQRQPRLRADLRVRLGPRRPRRRARRRRSSASIRPSRSST